MSTKVLKYPVEMEKQFKLALPASAAIAMVGVQGEEPFVWCRVDDAEENVEREFLLAGTGHEVPTSAIHLGSFQIPTKKFVGHLFEIPGTNTPETIIATGSSQENAA